MTHGNEVERPPLPSADDGTETAKQQHPVNALLPITGLILAGGAGRRMGGADKGWLSWHGQPLIKQALQRLRGQVAEILISANRNLDRYSQWGYPVLTDPQPGFQGPLLGLLAGLQAARQPWLLSLPVDSPALPADIVARFWEARGQSDIVVARSETHWQAVLCLCRSGLAPHLRHYLEGGGRRAQDWFRDLDYCTLVLPVENFRNCNLPEDLE